MIISSESYRRLASRVPATIQAGRAQYLTSPKTVSEATAKPAAHIFVDEAARAFDAAAPTGIIDLDLASKLGVRYPATTANLLARYLVLREGEEFELAIRASCVMCYVIKGSGRSFWEGEVIEWNEGDAFLYPGGGEAILNEAPNGNAVLFVVTDEPFMSMMGGSAPSPETARVKSAHYVARTITAQLEDMAEKSEQPRTQTVLQFGSTCFEDNGCVAPMIGAGIATLEAGTDQLPHCHDADTISLCLECDGVYSLVEGSRTEWLPNVAILTPAGAVHSQHAGGEGRMFSFFVQDRGPRAVRTWVPEKQESEA